MLKVINATTGEVYASITTNNSMTIEEALELAGYVVNEDDSFNHSDYIHEDGTEVWVEECEISVED